MTKTTFLQKHLLAWFKTNKRSFPWRSKTTTPYEVLIAEIMLRRTTSKVAASVFIDFIKEWPNLITLKKASKPALLKIIRPLGKYNLKAKVFKTIAKALKPQTLKNLTLEKLLTLYGIGPYTANAYLCFALNHRTIIVDSNVARIYHRFFGVKSDDLNHPTLHSHLLAVKYLPLVNYQNFNMALLDFGALICTPRNPNCHICPIKKQCLSKK